MNHKPKKVRPQFLKFFQADVSYGSEETHRDEEHQQDLVGLQEPTPKRANCRT